MVTIMVRSEPLNAPQMPTRVGSVASAPVRKPQLIRVRTRPSSVEPLIGRFRLGAAVALGGDVDARPRRAARPVPWRAPASRSRTQAPSE